MYSEKIIQAWVDEGGLRFIKDRFIAEIGICANQQVKIDSKLFFSINDLIKISRKNDEQFKKLEDKTEP